MISFQKEDVEFDALKRLKKYDIQKYKEAYKSEKPDIQNDIENVGVEVVVVDFEEIFSISQLYGVSFLKFLKMTKCMKLKKRELDSILKYPEDHPSIEKFLSYKPAYNKGEKAHYVRNISEIRELKPREDIFLTRYSKYQFHLDSNGNIKFVIPPAQWTGQLPKMMLDKLKNKEQKTISYKQFAEMNLYLHSLTSDIEEIQEFEGLLKEYHKENPSVFKNIYLPTFWESEHDLYHITLK